MMTTLDQPATLTCCSLGMRMTLAIEYDNDDFNDDDDAGLTCNPDML